MDRYEVPKTELCKLLVATGWLDDAEALTEAELEFRIKQYQEFHGLKVDGVAGHVTERTLRHRYCSVPDHMGTDNCKWNKRSLTVVLLGTPPAFSAADWLQAWQEAVGAWERICNISFKFSSSINDADIIVQVGNIDGASGTLAWSELPCAGDDRRLQQRYDRSEPFVIALNPPSSKIDAVRVIRHEVGHAIGIGHLKAGNLMQAMYDPRIRDLQPGDIEEGRARYGVVVSTTSTPTSDLASCVVQIPEVGTYEGQLRKR